MILKIVDMRFSYCAITTVVLLSDVPGDRIPSRQIPSRVIDCSLRDRSSEPFASKKIHARTKRFMRFKKDSCLSKKIHMHRRAALNAALLRVQHDVLRLASAGRCLVGR
jgi:hypothetical protein